MAVSPVTGKREVKTQTYIYCIGVRNSKEKIDCGPDAKHFRCGRILEDENPCGDEGRMCDVCAAEAEKEHAWMRGQSQGACTGVMSEQDKQGLRDAGRGHLVSP